MRHEVQVCRIFKTDVSVMRQEQILEAMIKLLKVSTETVSEKKVAEKK